MKKALFLGMAVLVLALSCASIGGGAAGEGVSLSEAVEQSAAAVAEKLPPKTRVAIVAFEAEHENLAGYIMDEITGALVDGEMEVADRNNLAFVFKELNFQMSGMVDDASAASVGKFLGAAYVLTGQLVPIGGAYRYRLNAIKVETAKHEASERLDVWKDRATQNLVAALAMHKPAVRTADYGEKAAARAGTAPPASAGSLLDRGIMFAMRGDYELAIKDFTEAIALNPDLYAAYMLRGRALYASVSKITDVYENFSGVDSSINSSTTKEQEAVYKQALADYSQAIKLEPNSAKAYHERGEVYLSNNDYDQAIADYNQSIKLDPNYARVYQDRGVAYSQKGDYDRAIADYNQAIKLDPNDATPYHNRGHAYKNKGEYDRAIADFTQAIKLDPNNPSIYESRSHIYNEKGDYDRAITDYTQAIKFDPNDVAFYIGRGHMYSSQQPPPKVGA